MFDYIIIGGGSAGCVLGARLTQDPTIKVALLEAVPPDKSTLIHCPAGLAVMPQSGQHNWQFATVPQAGLNGRKGYEPRGKVLGGSSSINAMIYTRGHHTDYDNWAAEGNWGWSYADVLPYFKRAEPSDAQRISDFYKGDCWASYPSPIYACSTGQAVAIIFAPATTSTTARSFWIAGLPKRLLPYSAPT